MTPEAYHSRYTGHMMKHVVDVNDRSVLARALRRRQAEGGIVEVAPIARWTSYLDLDEQPTTGQDSGSSASLTP